MRKRHLPRCWAVVAGVASLTMGAIWAAHADDTTLTYQAAVLKSKPVAYWRLGEARGPTARDATPQKHHGTYHGTPLLGQPGALLGDNDTSIRLDGKRSYVEIPS